MIVTIESEESDDVGDAREKDNAILKAISSKFDFNTLRVDKKDVKMVLKVRVFVD